VCFFKRRSGEVRRSYFKALLLVEFAFKKPVAIMLRRSGEVLYSSKVY
jgi:hypothetical protein